MNRPIISSQTVTLLLAYVHHYTCKFLPKRLMGGRHLSTLAAWLGQPSPNLRTARQHPLLVAHLALLYTAELLDTGSGCWTCTPAAFDWLQADHQTQLERLHRPLIGLHKNNWTQTVNDFGLTDTLPLHYTTYLTQQLTRQRKQPSPPPDYATWLPIETEQWLLDLPDHLPNHLRFHLHQLGEWQPGRPLCCTPTSLGRASQRGYGGSVITAVFTEATGQPLSPEQTQQLNEWLGRVGTYQIRTVTLLSTRQPEQLAHVARHRRFQERIYEQISPHHAIVSADLAPNLHRWLERQGYGLTPPPPPEAAADLPDPAYAWLGLRLLTDVAALTGYSLRPPESSLAAAEAHLSPTQLADLEARASALLDQLRQAIRGRDAFLPGYARDDSQLVAVIRQALAQGKTVHIAYQSLVDRQPHWREVFPLRLEQQGELHYLHAYCHLAEANRIFRLDRVHAYRLAETGAFGGTCNLDPLSM